ncbi:MAG: polysaccharide biosynthesis protein [Candidatus Aminicenantes bacterium]|nr:polysaccharide biosynthesis protein [Candidatus Aminicenantes bacterium]
MLNLDSKVSPPGQTGWLQSLLTPTPLKRTLFFLAADLAIFSASLYLSFLLRFGFIFPEEFRGKFLFWLAVMAFVSVVLLALFGLYSLIWRFCGLIELFKLTAVLILSLLTFSLLNLTLRWLGTGRDIPFGVIVMTVLLGFSCITFLRFLKAIYRQLLQRKKEGMPTLIVGANFKTERLIRELLDERRSQFFPVLIVDDDPRKVGSRISGIKVAGGFERLPALIRSHRIEAVFVVLPPEEMRKVPSLYEKARRAGITRVNVLRQSDECDSGVFHVKDFRHIDIEDLLRRPEIKIDYDELKKFFAAQTVFVSGAAGTIGSEIVRKLVHFGVKRIVGYEIDETEIFNLKHELRLQLGARADCLLPVVGDIRDREKLERIVTAHRPDLVFHAAACKHVPLMEDFPEEAVKTNIFGTKNLAELAAAVGSRKFINISTDKAVNPSGILGASKRAAEVICRSLDGERTRFMSVRFGNVLGSRGSVIPLFLSQIRNGGPLTVTHPDMRRYFMATSEAVLLVFQAALMGRGGEVFVLDMGEPIRIVDLAEDLIRLNGLEPHRDIEIVYTGFRPGEKLFEELLTAEEGTDPTLNSQIYCARNGTSRRKEEIELFLHQLTEGIAHKGRIEQAFMDFLPFYKRQRGDHEHPSTRPLD